MLKDIMRADGSTKEGEQLRLRSMKGGEKEFLEETSQVSRSNVDWHALRLAMVDNGRSEWWNRRDTRRVVLPLSGHYTRPTC